LLNFQTSFSMPACPVESIPPPPMSQRFPDESFQPESFAESLEC
jgi:hypothetical protein